MATLFETLITPDNVIIIVSVYTIIKVSQGFIKIPKRLKPIVSIALATVAVYADWYGVKNASEIPNHANLMMMGLVLGNAASHSHKILRDTIFGAHETQKVNPKTGQIELDKQAMLIEKVRKTLT